MTDTNSDVMAITQLLNLYGLAVDAQRWELFDRIFATDVDADDDSKPTPRASESSLR